MLRDYNEFSQLMFKSRATERYSKYHIQKAIEIGNRMGIDFSQAELSNVAMR